MRSLDLGLYELSTNEKFVVGWGGWGGWVGGLGVIIESNLNRVRLSCCWVGVGLGCDNKKVNCKLIGIFNNRSINQYMA